MANSWKSILLILSTVLVSSLPSARAETFLIDNSHTSVIFGVSHLGYSFTYGRFNRVQGGFNLDRTNPAASKFQLVIDASSIDSNDAKRDEHLKGPDFFNVKQFPSITFESTGIVIEKTEQGEFYNMTGNFTIHGKTKQVTLPVQKLGEGKGPYGKYRAGFLCRTKFLRSDFGMTNMIPNVGDEIAVTVSFEGLRQDASAGSQAKPAQ